MTSLPMMKCGHQANATSNGQPACAICGGLTPDALIVTDKVPELDDRTAKCYCGVAAPSARRDRLAFFEHCPLQDFDRFYCGCRGWD